MTPTPAPSVPITPVPEPTAQHHANFASFLSILIHLTQAAVMVAPIALAPFVKNANSQAILAAETPIAQALAEELGKIGQ